MKVTTEVRQAPGPRKDDTSHIVRKWGVTGYVRINFELERAHVVIDVSPDPLITPGIDVPVDGHERGHASYFEDLLAQGFTKAEVQADDDIWMQEVDAWVRSLPCPFPLWVGQLALDCLWTYKVGKRVSAALWQEAVDLLAETCEDPQALRDYTPEPVPPGEEGNTQDPVEWCEGDPADNVPPAKGEGKPPQGDGEAPPQAGGDPMQDGVGDLPEDADDDEPPTNAPRPPSGPGRDDKDKARDAWLLVEGVIVAGQGSKQALEDALRAAGHSVQGPLPVVTEAVLTAAGGIW